MTERSPLSLHIPQPRFRPGEKPDFSDLKTSAPGEVRRPPIDTAAADMRDLADRLARGGVHHIKEASGGRVGPRAVNEKLHLGMLRRLQRYLAFEPGCDRGFE